MKNWIRLFLPLAVVLTVIAVGQQVLQIKQNRRQISGYRQNVLGISENGIDQVLISDQKGKLSLVNRDGIWKLDGKKAEEEKIKNIISVVLDKDGSNYDLISQNSGRFDEFKVGSDSAKIILMAGTQERLAVFIGASSYPGNFVRLDKENNVYLTTKSLGEISTEDRQIYLDKSILSVGSNNIQRIYVDNTKEVYTLIKNDNKWKMENSTKEVDENKLNALLSYLENMKADKVIETAAEKNDYKQKYGFLMLLTNDSKSETLVFSKGKSNFMISRTSDDQLFTVTQSILDNVLKPSKDLTK